MLTTTVHIPAELAALIDERRGGATRNAYITELLSAALGVTIRARRRGRPFVVVDESEEHIRIIGRIGRDDDAYREAWHKRIRVAHSALEAIGLTIDEPTRMRLVREQWAAFPHYHPLAGIQAPE